MQQVLEKGVDFVTIGNAAILHHDFPNKIKENIDFKPVHLPVTKEYLTKEGLGPKFIQYLGNWPGFVKA